MIFDEKKGENKYEVMIISKIDASVEKFLQPKWLSIKTYREVIKIQQNNSANFFYSGLTPIITD